MVRPRLWTTLIVAGILGILAAAASPWIIATYWQVRASNPVRRGLVRAGEFGCFSCHGPSGTRGIPIPGGDQGVPAWSGGVWMMYVESEEDVRKVILEGSSPTEGEVGHADHDHASATEHETRIVMPAYGDVLSQPDLSDLVATFKVLSGMVKPPPGSSARAGLDLAREWRCFSCHGPAGAGGLANPGSFTGFVPGWYGSDFRELVRDRNEFDAWILDGRIPRLSQHPIARYFLERQKLRMPGYREFSTEQLDALWAYVLWLGETDGGHAGEIAKW
mgnify:FL=1